MKFQKQKKGQSLSLGTIVIAILVLVVLVIIIAITTQKTSSFNEDSSEISDSYSFKRCEIPGTGRECRNYEGGCPSGMSQVSGEFSDCEDPLICCSP